MKIVSVLSRVIVETKQFIKENRSNEGIYKHLEELCCKDVITQLEKIKAGAVSETEGAVHQKIELFFSNHWEQVKCSALAYTAINDHLLVSLLYELATRLSEVDPHTPPRSPLEFMMPGVSLLSIDRKFRHWCAFDRTPALKENEKIKLNHLMTSLSSLSEIEEGVYLTLTAQQLAYESEQTLFQNGDLINVRNYFIPKLADPREFFAKHILTLDGTGIIPISILLDKNEVNPYATLIQASERYRITQHSVETIALAKERDLLQHLERQDKSLLGQLNYLCRHLRLNDSHIGRGKEHDAASGAYVAIIGFQEYFQSLSKDSQQRLPKKLFDEIELLIQLCSDPTKNQNAVENLSTCIAKRREAIEGCIKEYQNIISHIAITETNFIACLNVRREAVKKAEDGLQYKLSTQSYSGKDNLPITKKLLDQYKFTLHFSNETELCTLLLLPLDEAKAIAIGREVELVKCIPNFNDLVLFMTNTPLSLLETFFFILGKPIIEHFLLNRPRDALELLSTQHDEKFQCLLEELIKADYFKNHIVWTQRRRSSDLPVLHHFILSSLALSKILELIPIDENRLARIVEKNSDNKSLLHLIAGNPESIRVTLMSLSQEDRILAIKQKNADGYTHIHLCANDPKTITAMLSTLSTESQYALLRDVFNIENIWGNTPLHLAAESNSPNALLLFLKAFSNEERLFRVKQQNRKNDTPLHVACYKGNLEAMQDLLSALLKDDRMDEIRRKGSWKSTLLHYAIPHRKILSFLIDLYPEDERLDAIKQRNLDGFGVFDLAIELKSSAAVKVMLRSLIESDRFLLMNKTNAGGCSPMHLAALHGAVNIIKVFLSVFPVKNHFELISVQSTAKYTPLHYAAIHKQSEVLSIVLSCYPLNDRYSAIQQKNSSGESALQIAVNNEKSLLTILSMLPEQDFINSLVDISLCTSTLDFNITQLLITHFSFILACHPEVFERISWLCSETDGKQLVNNALESHLKSLNATSQMTNIASTLFFKKEDQIKNLAVIAAIKRYLSGETLSMDDKAYLREGICGKIFDCYQTATKKSHFKELLGKGYVRHEVIGDRKYCGFTAFGITRERAVNLLIENIHNVRELLEPVVKELLLNEHFYNYLIKKNLLQSTTTFKTAKTQFTDLAVISGCIQYDLNEKMWADPAILQALAHIQKISIHIWTLDAVDKHLLPHCFKDDYVCYQPAGATQRLDILCSNGNLFERLDIVGFGEGNFLIDDSEIIYPLEIQKNLKKSLLEPRPPQVLAQSQPCPREYKTAPRKN